MIQHVHQPEIDAVAAERAKFEPTPADFADPRFDAIWSVIKTWDVPHGGGLRDGASGNDVVRLLRALDGIR